MSMERYCDDTPMTAEQFHSAKNIYCFGVGGIGVSAIARYFLSRGAKVGGSDVSRSPVTDGLEKEGVQITVGQKVSDVPKECDLIVYSAAIEVAEPNLLKAIKQLPVPSLSYSEALGTISKGMYTIAVAGTHGKTTTTAMIAKILMDTGLSPTVVVGSILNETKSNFVRGESQYFVVEADEYRHNFLSLSPKILVITNIDEDHLDYYRDLEDIQSAFAELVAKVPKDGVIVTHLSNANVTPAIKNSKAPVLDYGSIDSKWLVLPLPGSHNRDNARAALVASGAIGVKDAAARTSLRNFKGTWRRFEYKGETSKGALIYDDYAHNPAKVAAAISGAREAFPDKDITIVFQPHLYSRTKSHLESFADALSAADYVIVTDIFAAREVKDYTISSDDLAERVRAQNVNVLYLPHFEDIVAALAKSASSKDVIITVGAGDIYKVADALVAE